MSKFFGVLLGTLGVVAGLAVGLFIAAYGVLDVVDGITADPASAKTIVWGVIQIFFLSYLVGYAIAIVVGAIAIALFGSSTNIKRIRGSKSPFGSSAFHDEFDWQRRSRGL